MSKPSFDDIYMDLAENLAKRSHCVKAQVGAVLTKDTRIVSLGYNGPQKVVRATAKEVAHWHYTLNRMLFCMRQKTMFLLKALLCT